MLPGSPLKLQKFDHYRYVSPGYYLPHLPRRYHHWHCTAIDKWVMFRKIKRHVNVFAAPAHVTWLAGSVLITGGAFTRIGFEAAVAGAQIPPVGVSTKVAVPEYPLVESMLRLKYLHQD